MDNVDLFPRPWNHGDHLRLSNVGKNSVQGFSSAKTIAIMQIISIISCDFVNLSMGIVSLVFLNDDEVKAYLRNRGLSL